MKPVLLIFGDGTAHKNRMQGNDFVQSLMYTRGVTCFTCHDVHGTANDAYLISGTTLQIPPRGATGAAAPAAQLDAA